MISDSESESVTKSSIFYLKWRQPWSRTTAILIIIGGRFQAFERFSSSNWYQKPLKAVSWLSIILRMAVVVILSVVFLSTLLSHHSPALLHLLTTLLTPLCALFLEPNLSLFYSAPSSAASSSSPSCTSSPPSSYTSAPSSCPSYAS